MEQSRSRGRVLENSWGGLRKWSMMLEMNVVVDFFLLLFFCVFSFLFLFFFLHDGCHAFLFFSFSCLNCSLFFSSTSHHIL